MTTLAISWGPMDPTWYAIGLALSIIGSTIILAGIGSSKLVSDKRMFRFCCLTGAFALVIGLVLIGVSSILPYY
jgi:hypothetical protein